MKNVKQRLETLDAQHASVAPVVRIADVLRHMGERLAAYRANLRALMADSADVPLSGPRLQLWDKLEQIAREMENM